MADWHLKHGKKIELPTDVIGVLPATLLPSGLSALSVIASGTAVLAANVTTGLYTVLAADIQASDVYQISARIITLNMGAHGGNPNTPALLGECKTSNTTNANGDWVGTAILVSSQGQGATIRWAVTRIRT